MRLDAGPFGQVKSGAKRFEIRLNDEKRRLLAVGDRVTFWNKDEPADEVTLTVADLIVRPNFIELFRAAAPELGGWPHGTTSEEAAADMRKFYEDADERRWGAVAIRLTLE